MSATRVSKYEVDLLVRAADEYGRVRSTIEGEKFRWWRVDEGGDYAGWNELDAFADALPSYEDWLKRKTPSEVGQMLDAENVRSLAYRYRDDDPPGESEFEYADPGRVLTPGEVFKALDHYEYQSCESPNWRQTEAYAFCRALRETACRFVDGYAEAPWGFREREASAR
jgi:hypothetical protein